MANVLIIDDDQLNSDMLFDMISDMGHATACAFTAEEGLREAMAKEFDVVFLDVQLPDGNGLMLLPDIQSSPSAPEVIIITGFGSPDGAELAIKNGAWDFIEKPLIRNMIELPLVRALQYREAKKGSREPLVLRRDGIVGSSPIMDTCMELVAQAAASDAPVIITGETGTGKELFARAIHNNSSRSGGTFVTVDCASLPPTIIESVLFGHEKGAFTGADRYRDGLIKQADGGTLFLDEIGELPLPAQKTFLRVLQERSFRPVGGSREIKSEFRLTAATNRDLKRMVQEETFREDLLFRLRAFTIELPPLKKRPGDIRELCFHYVNKLCTRYGKELKGFSPEFMDALCSYEWPGNIRELVNALERALAVASADPILFPKHLPTHIRIHIARDAIHKKEASPPSHGATGTLKERREGAVASEERKYLQELVAATGGSIPKACEISGLSRVRLYVLLNKYNITRKSPPAVS
ncbi:MAG: sigma-54 dependent transcriptional regulator [Deltaproteobacteria bacterium]|nr:sigma-54 dependent transcriptional regulator [Deltaproteobacteria bacterium]